MASLREASRKQHSPNGQKASSFAPVDQSAPMAYHMTPEFPGPPVPMRVQKTANKKVMHAPGRRGDKWRTP